MKNPSRASLSLLTATAIALAFALCIPSPPVVFAQGKKPARDPGDFHPLTAVAFSPDAKTLAVGISRYSKGSAPHRGTVELWDVETGKKKETVATLEGR